MRDGTLMTLIKQIGAEFSLTTVGTLGTGGEWKTEDRKGKTFHFTCPRQASAHACGNMETSGLGKDGTQMTRI